MAGTSPAMTVKVMQRQSEAAGWSGRRTSTINGVLKIVARAKS
jgi:hypothetical protein